MRRFVRRTLAVLLLGVLLVSTFSCGQNPPIHSDSGVPSGSSGQTTPGENPISSDDAIQARAEQILASMTLDEKIGQMILARCPVLNAAKDLERYHLSGYILFAKDFRNRTVKDVQTLFSTWQKNAKIGVFLAVDEEGGTVTRISRYPAFRSQAFQSPQALYAEGGMERITADTLEKCELLRLLGINLNFAPVVDVCQDRSAFIYARSMGGDVELVSEFARIEAEIYKKQSVGCVLKHFPGYGSSSDTHTGKAVDTRPLEAFLTGDFLPFQAGIEAGADAVLVSHNTVLCMDANNPASLSPEVHRVLRETLGFDGVIITDELSMGALQGYTTAEIAVEAVRAGNDLLCCTNYAEMIIAIRKACEEGVFTEERLEQSVLRILRMKLRLGIVE